MPQYKFSLIKYMKLHYHLYMSESYIKKAEKMLAQIQKLKLEAEKHKAVVQLLLKEMEL